MKEINSIKTFIAWCQDNEYRPCEVKAVLAYDKIRGFKPGGLK